MCVNKKLFILVIAKFSDLALANLMLTSEGWTYGLRKLAFHLVLFQYCMT